MSFIASTMTFWYGYYYFIACSNIEYYGQNKHTHMEFEENVETPLFRMIWISFVALAVVLFTVGTFMLRRLRFYFKGFFKVYGRSLWIANILLTLPLTFRAFLDSMR